MATKEEPAWAPEKRAAFELVHRAGRTCYDRTPHQDDVPCVLTDPARAEELQLLLGARATSGGRRYVTARVYPAEGAWLVDLACMTGDHEAAAGQAVTVARPGAAPETSGLVLSSEIPFPLRITLTRHLPPIDVPASDPWAAYATDDEET